MLPVPIPPGDPVDDSPPPENTVRESDADLLGELRRASGMAIPAVCRVAVRHGVGGKLRKGSERTPVWDGFVPISVPLLMAEIPKGCDTDEELTRRQQVWEAGEVHEFIRRALGQQQTATKNTLKPHTEEHRGKRACALTARGSISKARKGLVGGAAVGSKKRDAVDLSTDTKKLRLATRFAW